MNYRAGELLFLTAEEENMAKLEQSAALESDEREGLIADYLDTLLPDDWDKMDLSQRRGFLRDDPFTGGNRVGTVKRKTVCALEVWCECLGKDSHRSSVPTPTRFSVCSSASVGWERSTCNKTGARRFPLYGMQRCFDRISI